MKPTHTLAEVAEQAPRSLPDAEPGRLYAWGVAPDEVEQAAKLISDAGWIVDYPKWTGDQACIFINARKASDRSAKAK